ncbi:MAG TPA: LysM peptidoglycan-binding domain-containing protein [Anaeromyxobacter sp.]
MHNATTKQRLSALRRRLGIFSGAPRWVRERRERLGRLHATIADALGLGRPMLAGAASETPTPVFAMPAVSSPPTRADEPSSSRWVTDGMVLAPAPDSSQATTEVVSPPATTEVLSAADVARTLEIAMPEGTEGASPGARIAVIAAVVVAAVAGLVFALMPGVPSPAQVERPLATENPVLAPVRPARPALAETPPAPAAVRVRRGDTLWALAAKHLGDPARWPRLHEANRDRIRDPDLIYPGQRLEVPAR